MDSSIAGSALRHLYTDSDSPSLRFLTGLVGQPPCCAWCLMREGKGLAVIWYQCAGSEAELLDLRVQASERRAGLGRKLLLGTVDKLVNRSVTRVDLDVRASNRAARALYEGVGFRTTGERRAYYPAAAGREDAILMSLSLPTASVLE
ncbi:MAG: GNAT family N-acetyltransferase [Luminiphilus sp.]|nr:GNAT family N-acetyltransferase [Luminiphilus sp.]